MVWDFIRERLGLADNEDVRPTSARGHDGALVAVPTPVTVRQPGLDALNSFTASIIDPDRQTVVLGASTFGNALIVDNDTGLPISVGETFGRTTGGALRNAGRTVGQTYDATGLPNAGLVGGGLALAVIGVGALALYINSGGLNK